MTYAQVSMVYLRFMPTVENSKCYNERYLHLLGDFNRILMTLSCNREKLI